MFLRNSSYEGTGAFELGAELRRSLGTGKVEVLFLHREPSQVEQPPRHSEVLLVRVLELLSPRADGFQVELVEVGGPLGVGLLVELEETVLAQVAQTQQVQSPQDLLGNVVNETADFGLHQVLEQQERVELEVRRDLGVLDNEFEVVDDVPLQEPD